MGGGGELDTDLLHHPVLGAKIELLDDARVPLDPSGTHPVEVGPAFFPFGDQTWHNDERVIQFKIEINNY